MCRVWTEADRMARCAESKETVFLQYMDDNAFELEYLMLNDLLRQGLVGKVQHLKLIRGSDLDATTVLKSQASAQDNGGGALLDYGSHGITGAWTAIGYEWKPIRVFTNRIGVLHRHRILEGEPFVMEVDDNAQFEILFQRPKDAAWLTVFMETSYAGLHIGDNPDGETRQNRDLWVQGESGRLESLRDGCFRVHRWDGGKRLIPRPEYAAECDAFDKGVSDFLDGIRSGQAPVVDGRMGAEVMAVIGAVYLSGLSKRAVTLDEFKEYCGTSIGRFGDNAEADDAIVTALTEPFRLGEPE